MKVVYPICCGVDVHKTFLVATIITSQGISFLSKKLTIQKFNFVQSTISHLCGFAGFGKIK